MPLRPKYLNLLQIRMPLPAIVSIMHRASGAVLFLALPLESIDEMTIKKRLQDIGKTKDAEPTLA